ncbi:MAG: efflux RND transporter periplasmic adaptor subunit [Opitutaceae bacterium]|jgi:membrane fusion protein (multidrug efflux system)
MLKKFILALVGFALVVVILGLIKFAQIKKLTSQPHVMPASSVTTVEAVAASWRPVLSAIATLAPVEGVTLGTDADGIIARIAVENGADVKAGDLLVEFDTTVEAAQLAAAESRFAIAKLDHTRAVELREKNTNSQAELDQADAQLNQAKADVEAVRAQLDKKRVRAPFAGRVGIRLVNVGQFVSRGAALMPLQRLDPIYVNFMIPQRYLPQLVAGQTVDVKVDAFGDRTFVGKINAINPQVDASSRNVSVQAIVENKDEILRSGMFARVEVLLPEDKPSIVLPATAIAYASYGNSVFVIENMKGPDGHEYLGARQQFVKLGATRGDQVAVLGGINPGEAVASAGVFKLRNGAPVQVNNTKLPSNNPTPVLPNT